MVPPIVAPAIGALGAGLVNTIFGGGGDDEAQAAAQAQQDLMLRQLQLAEQTFAGQAPLRNIGLGALGSFFGGTGAGPARGIFQTPTEAGSLEVPQAPPGALGFNLAELGVQPGNVLFDPRRPGGPRGIEASVQEQIAGDPRFAQELREQVAQAGPTPGFQAPTVRPREQQSFFEGARESAQQRQEEQILQQLQQQRGDQPARRSRFSALTQRARGGS